MRFQTLGLLLVLAFASPSAADHECRDTVPFDSVLSSIRGGISGPLPEQTHVLRTQRQWCELWNLAHSGLTDPPPCDVGAADFRHEVIVAVARWNFGGSCHGISVSCIDATHGRGALRVFVREFVPGPGCQCTQNFSSKVHAVVVDKPVGRVEFVTETAVLQCP